MIDKIEIYGIKIALDEPFVISKGALTHARNTIVKIYDHQGNYGVGECCPYRSIHGETQAGTLAFAKDLAEAMIGKNPEEIHDLVHLMNKMIVGNASIKSAVDMALYDLNAKNAGKPLYAYLGGSKNKKIVTDNTVSLMSEDKMVEKAEKFVAQGFKILKLKLGDRPAINDINRVKAVRKAVGDGITLRVDANQGWNYTEAKKALFGIADCNIEHCEEPVHAANIIDQARLTAISPIPLMADEAVFNHVDALRVVRSKAADLINIKLGKSGGIYNAMKIAAIAEAGDINCQLGCFSETRLGISAMAHFDLAWNHILFHDLDSPLMLSEDPVIGGITYGKGWSLEVPDTPGHGADLDSSFLSNFDKITVK